ncbi:regulatory signaling modulator protein AmpE [Dasania sp. GY-MA-18]|uniref:Regulatory signaling modulator protein AmpE n=1 Tax=Dasania phycosphaerae TaxID=2950436 RepID=A0A9J6RQ02_9GAMM|nr:MULTISPECIES: regulatory signaling modulator protein AmpE [Dasania]MCR8923667.1 regulatory signaling modulator protein AmpE [Dasania sp. GY-MA-18]MCZ0866101.1 regulatory signaling modulator protein AmpE [Dasania phycosphaerae]MCZ0869825.1 regulatory signaling modulator protein AmpE [Dasania phycosphaerae]
MIFFSILIVLAILQIWGSQQSMHKDGWLQPWLQCISDKITNPAISLALIVLLPLLAVALLDLLLADVLFGLLSLVFYVLVLLYSLGRGEFSEAIDHYLMSWRAGNFESAYQKATAIGDFHQSEAIDDPQTLHNTVRAALLYEGYQRWFAVVFWFLVLGPAGALAYRLCYLTGRINVHADGDQDEPLQQQALQVTHYLDWLPARLLAGAFALTGRFETTAQYLLAQGRDNKPLPELLDSCALAALHDDTKVFLSSEPEQAIEQGEREINAVQALLSRSVMCWLVAIALLQLIL